MARAGWILEVQRKVPDGERMLGTWDWDNMPVGVGDFVHVGYVSRIFRTRKAAAAYYDARFAKGGSGVKDGSSWMRPLNSHRTWTSDWDASTRLRFVVRARTGERLTLPA